MFLVNCLLTSPAQMCFTSNFISCNFGQLFTRGVRRALCPIRFACTIKLRQVTFPFKKWHCIIITRDFLLLPRISFTVIYVLFEVRIIYDRFWIFKTKYSSLYILVLKIKLQRNHPISFSIQQIFENHKYTAF